MHVFVLQVLKPWYEGDQVWLGWSQSVKVRVTRELLIKLASHKVTFRVWDTKDRVSTKARNDRPKAFRLPQTRSGEETDHLGRNFDSHLSCHDITNKSYLNKSSIIGLSHLLMDDRSKQ